jgi:hypothetical protein
MKIKEMFFYLLTFLLLEDGKYYFVWFAYKSSKPAQMSLEFTFADLGTKKAKFSSALDNALGLHHK